MLILVLLLAFGIKKRNILKIGGNIFNNKLWFASKGNTHVNILNLNAPTKGQNFVRLEQEATSNVNKRSSFFGPMQTYPIFGDMCISGSQTKLDGSWTVERNKQQKKKIPSKSVNKSSHLKRQNNAWLLNSCLLSYESETRPL